MIGHRKGIQEELIKLASEYPKDNTNRCIIYCNKFCDEFNLYATNNTNNSVLLYTFSITPLDSTIDSSEFTYLVAIRYEHKDNTIKKTLYIKSLNELSDPKNNKLFYYANLKKFINVVSYNIGFMIDQLGKRNYINHAGGNSDYGAKYS